MAKEKQFKKSEDIIKRIKGLNSSEKEKKESIDSLRVSLDEATIAGDDTEVIASAILRVDEEIASIRRARDKLNLECDRLFKQEKIAAAPAQHKERLRHFDKDIIPKIREAYLQHSEKLMI